jgi:phage/plasmid-like protein (TIGR03299 family)
MAHEITATDGAVFHKEPAWHGLGYTVEEAMTPMEALKMAGLDWKVHKTVGIRTWESDTEGEFPPSYSDKFCAILREDTNDILSVQSPDYRIVQNFEVFDLAYSLGDNVKVESALSLQGGKKIICLIKGESFAPDNSRNDSMTQYLALLSSHDGTIALSGLPTSVRIVCSNTLKMALGTKKKNMIRFTHSGDMEDKKRQMRLALEQYANTGKVFKEQVNILSHTNMNAEQIKKFFLSVYELLESPIVSNPTTEKDYKNYLNATVMVSKWCQGFDDERRELNAPASVWMATNAVTKELQHRIPVKGRKTGWENRAYNNLMGASQDASLAVVNHALAWC